MFRASREHRADEADQRGTSRLVRTPASRAGATSTGSAVRVRAPGRRGAEPATVISDRPLTLPRARGRKGGPSAEGLEPADRPRPGVDPLSRSAANHAVESTRARRRQRVAAPRRSRRSSRSAAHARALVGEERAATAAARRATSSAGCSRHRPSGSAGAAAWMEREGRRSAGREHRRAHVHGPLRCARPCSRDVPGVSSRGRRPQRVVGGERLRGVAASTAQPSCRGAEARSAAS